MKKNDNADVAGSFCLDADLLASLSRKHVKEISLVQHSWKG